MLNTYMLSFENDIIALECPATLMSEEIISDMSENILADLSVSII